MSFICPTCGRVMRRTAERGKLAEPGVSYNYHRCVCGTRLSTKETILLQTTGGKSLYEFKEKEHTHEVLRDGKWVSTPSRQLGLGRAEREKLLAGEEIVSAGLTIRRKLTCLVPKQPKLSPHFLRRQAQRSQQDSSATTSAQEKWKE